MRKLPLAVQRKTAEKVAPDVTDKARAAFDSGETVYGTPRPRGVEGNELTLKRTGKLAATILFKVIGTRVRCVLGVPYAKYNVKYGMLPGSRGFLPVSWRKSIESIVQTVIADELS